MKPVIKTCVLPIGLTVALICAMLWSLSVGASNLSLSQTASVIGSHIGFSLPTGHSEADDAIIWLIRTPRVLLSAIVGALLAIGGVAIQALVRNPLADPYLIGVSSGASAGAAAAILLGFGSALGSFQLTGSAFFGSLLAIAFVLALGRIGSTMISSQLIFAGIAVGFAFTALTNFLIFVGDSRDGTRAVLFWMLGSLSQARWSSLPLATGALALCLGVFILWSRKFDALSITDDTALALGTNPTRFRAVACAFVAVGIAAATAVCGLIGFIGLVVPHIARHLIGGSHRLLFLISALLGALLLVLADALARTAFAPREMPLGILTAVIGTPLLVVLVKKALA